LNSLHVTDTRISSSLLGLGFPGSVHATIHTQTRTTQVEVRFESASTRFPDLDPVALVNHWKHDRLLQEPLHTFAVSMRAQESYDAFLTLQREGGNLGLRPAPTSERPLYYQPHFSRIQHPSSSSVMLDDLSLAAALGPLGIGLVKLHGSHGQHRYEMIATGYPVLDSVGTMIAHRTVDLIRFAERGPRRLALEDTQPLHPLVIGYDALYARQCLKKEIQRAEANLLITAGDGTAKQALIALNYKGHVGDAVSRHFKAPPGSLGL